MAFTVTSNSFRDGDYLPNDFSYPPISALAAPGTISRRT